MTLSSAKFPLAASLSLGFVVGWFIGSTGGDDKIVAAVLPVVVSAGGLLLFPKMISTDPDTGSAAAVNALSLCLIAFVWSLYFGTLIARAEVISNDSAEAKKALSPQTFSTQLSIIEYESDLRSKYLRNCTEMELRINKGRELSGLQPLPVEYFCQ